MLLLILLLVFIINDFTRKLYVTTIYFSIYSQTWLSWRDQPKSSSYPRIIQQYEILGTGKKFEVSTISSWKSSRSSSTVYIYISTCMGQAPPPLKSTSELWCVRWNKLWICENHVLLWWLIYKKTILLVFTYFIIKTFYIINYRGNLH